METVEVVIRIPKHDYDYILGQGDTRGTPHLAEAICNGIVLPKGHGRLVDADAITKHVEIFKQSFVINYDKLTGKSSIACTVPSVIEADKESDID